MYLALVLADLTVEVKPYLLPCVCVGGGGGDMPACLVVHAAHHHVLRLLKKPTFFFKLHNAAFI